MKLKEYSVLLTFTLIISSSYAQSGLNKSKTDLIAFISRPEYSAVYPEVTIEDKSIATFSKDLRKGVFYSLNSYGRCTGEVMSEKLSTNNYNSILAFFKGYLKAMNFEPSPDVDNKFVNNSERMIGYIEKNGEWLNIVFKKF